MKKLTFLSVVGARPNFMKIAPLLREFKNHENINSILVHTGQHYDENMSKLFFRELDIKRPDVNLNVGSGSHAVQTARIMENFEPVLNRLKPDIVIVVGDINSTLAGTLTAKKMGIPVAHIEAGLRSFDMTMPEEINRKLTDAISDFLFTTCGDASKNLIREGIARDRIHLVGNCMIDTLYFELKKMKEVKKTINDEYAVLTLHRPCNVDDKKKLTKLLELFNHISKKIKIIFPVHPRTRAQIKNFNLGNILSDKIIIREPLSYISFLKLYKDAKFIMTDSGGIQEETTVLKIPCLTLRENTERPVTITHGTNRLVGTDRDKILNAVEDALNNRFKRSKNIKYWDGRTSQRIAKILIKLSV